MSNIFGLYYDGMKPEELAQAVISKYYQGKEPSFPIDPFKMIRDFGIIYQFMEFEELEGIYIPPEEEDIPIIGINFNRPIARQRYTAAHELCHHLKDQGSKICPINGEKNNIEKYAEDFASALLMPTTYLKRETSKYLVNRYVDRYNILKIAEYFGTSFEATVFAVAYKLHMLEGDMDPVNIKSKNKEFKPEQKKREMGLDTEYVNLWEQIVNSYEYFWSVDDKYAWYIFKNDFIYHENRLERLNLDDDVVAEIVTDLRFNKEESQYCNETCKEIIEVAGHSALYDYIYETDDCLSIYKIQMLNKMLYQYAPFPEAGGTYRQDNNFVTGAEFETTDYQMVITKIIELDLPMKKLVERMEELSVSEVIKQVAIIHHKITVIHPFNDGNGRCARALLNWTYRIKGIPPIYIKFPEKEEYYEGLRNIDISQDYGKLYKVFMRETIRSTIQLNKSI